MTALAVLLPLALFCPSSTSAARAAEKQILGWAENVLIGRSQLRMRAKLDTGADTSSLHASRIRRYRGKDRQSWIEFRLADEALDRTIRFKKRLVRYAYIKEHHRPSQKRPVVKMEICLGAHQREIEVTLVDRSAFDFPVLLGRNALEGVAVVDPELRFTAPPECPRREDE